MRILAIALLLALSANLAFAASAPLDVPNAPHKRDCAVLHGVSCCH